MDINAAKLALALREAKCRVLRVKIKEAMNNNDIDTVKRLTTEIFQLSAKPLF